MPDQPFACLLIIWRHFVDLHIGQHAVNDVLIDFLPEHTVCHRYDGMGSPGIEACHNSSCRVLSNRHLRLVAVSPGTRRIILHSDDRLHHRVDLFFRESADPNQISAHLVLLIDKFLFIGKRLQLASAALPRYRAKRLHPVG